MSENLAATAPAPVLARAAGLIRWIERRPGAAFGGFLAVHFVVWTVLPALLWWLIEAVHRVFDADIAYYATAQIAVVVAFALVFALARPLVGAAGALAAILIADGLHYFQYTAVKFNHDVVQL